VILALIAPAFAYDPSHALLQKVLTENWVNGKVNYANIKANPADLDAYLKDVAGASLASMAGNEKKAFLINAYNALTIDTIADNFPLKSIQDLDGGKVWDTRRFPVGGQQLTLNDIENKMLRPLGDPRIHAAINCASIGCPPLSGKVFAAAALESQLETQAKKWAGQQKFENGVLTVNRIFDWYGEDFTKGYGPATFDIPGVDGKGEAAANFVAKYAPDKAAAIKAGGFTVAWAEYNWNVNKSQ
jgi:hypothetical protein